MVHYKKLIAAKNRQLSLSLNNAWGFVFQKKDPSSNLLTSRPLPHSESATGTHWEPGFI